MIETRYQRPAIAGVHGCYPSGTQFQDEVLRVRPVSRPATRVQMTLRAIASAFIGLIAATAGAAGDGGAWRTVAKAPRAALPDVEVTLGYSGPYIPTWNSPIVLRAAAHPHFSGLVGFRFAVGPNATRELAVVSAEPIERGRAWSFTTWARLKRHDWLRSIRKTPFNRELVIEWRSRDMKVIGQRSVGVPPWSEERPLLIARSAAPGAVLGLEPVAVDPAKLPAVAQWYEGFSAAVVPLETWLDLPDPVREAIVGSRLKVAFSGFPRQEQTLGAADRAILPVEFEPGPASWVKPWPARDAGSKAEAPLRWVPRAHATAVGGSDLPALVIGRAGVWAADEALLEVPLPADDFYVSYGYVPPISGAWRDLAAEFRLLIAALVTLLVTITAWFALRRRPRTAIIVVVIACAAIPLAARQRLRPYAWSMKYEQYVDLGGGLLAHHLRTIEHQPSPLPAHSIDPALVRTAVFGEDTEQTVEVRSSSTPIGAGMMYSSRAGWDSADRIWSRRELGAPLSIRVVSAAPARLVLDYDSAIASQYAAASWIAAGRRWYGEARLPHPTKGRITITNEILRPGFWWSSVGSEGRGDAVRVHLLQRKVDGWSEQWWSQPYRPGDRHGATLSISAEPVRTTDGALTCSIAIPGGVLTPRSRTEGRISSDAEIGELSVATAQGTWPVAISRLSRVPGQPSRVGFEIPPDALEGLGNGGVVTIRAVPVASVERGGSAVVIISFLEKSS